MCKRGGLATAAKYTVTFINAGSTYNTQTVNKGARPSNPGNPSRSGSNYSYAFQGWTTSNPGSGGAYYGQSLTTPSSTPVNSNITYYAVYRITASNQNASVETNADRGVTVGSAVRTNLNSLFSSATGRNFVNVTFSSASSSGYGVLYANSNETSLSGRAYSYSGSGYPVTDLYFVPSDSGGTYTVSYTADDGYSSVRGTLSIVSGGSASGTRITYAVKAGEEVEFDRDDFYDAFRTVYSDTVRWVQFTSVSSFSDSIGAFYYNYGRSSQREFPRSDLDEYAFYYDDDREGSYPLDELSFVAEPDADDKTITLSFRAYSSNSRYVDGTVEIRVGNSSSSDVTYRVTPGEETEFDEEDFYDFFRDNYSSRSLRYVTFSPDSAYDRAEGKLYYDYDGNRERTFTKSNLSGYRFYYDSSSYGDYPLDELSFVASDDFEDDLTLDFRAYYDVDSYVDGKLILKAEDVIAGGDIRYYTTANTNVQINPNDIARFFAKSDSSRALQYVELEGVPSGGTLYYNYYSASSYGTSSSQRLTASNCDDEKFYFSPSGNNQYALSELTYVPSGSNYCASIPFTAHAAGGRSVKGSILVSVSSTVVPEVYGVTPKNTAVNFPTSAVYSAVRTATSVNLAGIQILELPASAVGTLYYGSGTSSRADTSTRYNYSGSGKQMSQLRFVPAGNYTGSVEIPYVAYNSSDKAIASGTFSLGVVNAKKEFTDVNSSTWCYKYVEELSDAGVINGFMNGSFQPNKTVTYGQALKLIMLAADYPVQVPTGKHPFSGYLTRATSAGLVSGMAEKNLDQPISRLAVAQIAAKAMKLDGSNLSNVKPFTDTSDIYVQALNAAGIVEGYFSGGTSTFKPNGTMTRGQISAIVWRMDRAK